MTESQNQLHCFKSGKCYISLGKFTEILRKLVLNAGIKWLKMGSFLAKNCKARFPFWPTIKIFFKSLLINASTNIGIFSYMFSVLKADFVQMIISGEKQGN